MSAPSAFTGQPVPPDPADGRRHGVLAVFGALTAVLLIYIGYIVLRGSQSGSVAINGWGVDAFELAAGGLTMLAPRRHGRSRIVPTILGAAVITWAAGDTALTIETLHGAQASSPSLADLFYLTFFPLSYAAVVIFVRDETRRLVTPIWLDGAVAGVGAAAVLSVVAFGQVERTAHVSALAFAVNLAYPVGDVLLLLLVVGSTAVMSGRHRAPWMLLALGFAVNMLGDTSNVLPGLVGSPQAATVFDAIAWPTSSLLIALAMWLPSRATNPLASPRHSSFLLPALSAGAGLVILFLSSVARIDRTATVLAAVTLVLVVLRTVSLVRALRAQTQERHRQSVTDHLTGLGNRRRLFDALTALFADSVDDRPPFAFLFIDLNGFKRINDSFGHPAGDELLARVGERLTQALGSSNLLARVGGDEFAGLVFDTDAAGAVLVAERLAAALKAPFAAAAFTARIGASIGIALAPDDASDADSLVACADAAMYRAKLAGHPFAHYDRELDHAADKLRLADDLRSAIARGELVLHYQPQIRLLDGQIAAAEALVRWEHPEYGLLSPPRFLPLAEQAGLMQQLTRWVLDTALAQAAVWRSAQPPLTVSVNVSAEDLGDPGFPGLVSALLAEHEVPPSGLVIEITETMIITEFSGARAAVEKLRGLGVGVSIDDFGAGFTSLAYLNDLAVSELKLDRRFIQSLHGGRASRDSELVRAIIELGHVLGLRVVAEGIEDAAALDLLSELGCDLAQGYHVGRPAPAAELALAVAPTYQPSVPGGPLNGPVMSGVTQPP